MRIFRRRSRPLATTDGRSLGEIESDPGFLAAQERVNRGPAAPSQGDPYLDTIFGEQPRVVAVPGEDEPPGAS